MALFGLFNNGLAVSQTTQALQAGALSRREFLSALGGLTALTIAGCGDNPSVSRPDGGGGSGGDAGPDAGGPLDFRLETGFAKLPAKYTSDLYLDAGRVVGVATATVGGTEAGDRNHLFGFDPASSSRPIPSSAILDLPVVDGRFWNRLAVRSGTRGIVTANDGFYEVTFGAAPTQRFVAFPAGTTFGGGAAYAGGKLFVATANLNGGTYDPGQVLVYDVSGGGVTQESSLRTIATSRLNPTGVALRNASTLVVLNSGNFQSTARASIDLIDVASESVVRTIELGGLTAQVSAEIALSPDGNTAILGSADNSGIVMFVDLNSGVPSPRPVTGTRFHSSVKVDPDLEIAYVTDFNGGTVTIFDLVTRAILRSVALMAGEAGPSEIHDGALIQSLPYGAALIVPS